MVWLLGVVSGVWSVGVVSGCNQWMFSLGWSVDVVNERVVSWCGQLGYGQFALLSVQ